MSPRTILPLIPTVVLSGLWLACAPALAQQAAWPQQTIRVIVPQPPGGGTDALARLIDGGR